MTEIEKLKNLVDELEERHTDHVFKMSRFIKGLFQGLRDNVGESVDIGYDVENHINHIKKKITDLENRLNLLGQTTAYHEHLERKNFCSFESKLQELEERYIRLSNFLNNWKKFDEIENRIGALEAASPKKCYNIGNDNV